ncbi:hypothetical protein [Curtobacterium aetherium]|uniref:Uncharacterized protein n=1 Tax=Curtobacterium aetherium TaxID=2841594 RepID=A0ACD1E6X2_9MICO|nr:hypothetical protein [Curtobacterium sp. L6-1]QWS34538.1 hypothetical protein KM842_05160 [Curtobacterium sp. L6-1]
MIAPVTTSRTTGIALAVHGAAAILTRPVGDRARGMADRGFTPGLPHAVLVPALEIVAGSVLGTTAPTPARGGQQSRSTQRRRATRSSSTARGIRRAAAAAAAATTALAAVRVGAELDDRSVTAGTVAAAAVTWAGASATVAQTRGRARAGLLTAVGAVVVFELVRRRRVLRAR